MTLTLFGFGATAFLLLFGLPHPVRLGSYQPESPRVKMFLEQKIVPLLYRHPKDVEVKAELFRTGLRDSAEVARILGRPAQAHVAGHAAWIISSADRELLVSSVKPVSMGAVAEGGILTAEFNPSGLFAGKFMTIGLSPVEVEVGLKMTATAYLKRKASNLRFSFLWTEANPIPPVSLRTNAAFNAFARLAPEQQLLVVSFPNRDIPGSCLFVSAKGR